MHNEKTVPTVSITVIAFVVVEILLFEFDAEESVDKRLNQTSNFSWSFK